MAKASGYNNAEDWKEANDGGPGDDVYVDGNGNFFWGNVNQSAVPSNPNLRNYMFTKSNSQVANEQVLKGEAGSTAYTDGGDDGYADGGDDGFASGEFPDIWDLLF